MTTSYDLLSKLTNFRNDPWFLFVCAACSRDTRICPRHILWGSSPDCYTAGRRQIPRKMVSGNYVIILNSLRFFLPRSSLAK